MAQVAEADGRVWELALLVGEGHEPYQRWRLLDERAKLSLRDSGGMAISLQTR